MAMAHQGTGSSGLPCSFNASCTTTSPLKWRATMNAKAVELMNTAIAAFQPKVCNMKVVSHPQVPATINTGGAAYEVNTPPIEMFTNKMPKPQ